MNLMMKLCYAWISWENELSFNCSQVIFLYEEIEMKLILEVHNIVEVNIVGSMSFPFNCSQVYL